MSGILYIVGTPIGNLDDITLRSIKILSEVDIILAEDTRVTQKLLSRLSEPRYQISDIRNPQSVIRTISYHQHSDDRKKAEILKLLLEGAKIALITDAGTPGISDPGNELIQFIVNSLATSSRTPSRNLIADIDEIAFSHTHRSDQTLEEQGLIRIIPIPGPSAITTALSVSGFDVNKFVFLGFLPKKKRKKLFDWLHAGKIAFAFFESPYRILKTLENIKTEFGEDIQIFVARELTKIHETLYRGSVTEVIYLLQKDMIKGEIVVVVENKKSVLNPF